MTPREVEKKLVKLWPDAGRALGYKSRSAAYAAASKGHIKTVKIGNLMKVSKRWLSEIIDGEPAAADVSSGEAPIRAKIEALLLGALPNISGVTCENTYQGVGDEQRLVKQRITLVVTFEEHAQ